MKCFKYHNQNNIQCKKINCRFWINCDKYNNCCLIGSQKKDNLTLQDVGKIFNVTRMRICQIEKNAIKKLKEKIFKQ